MALTPHMVTIDCVDHQALAAFWTQAAGYTVGSDWGEYVVLVPADGGFRLGLQKVAEPRVGKNRVHVDWRTADRGAEVARLAATGATVMAEHAVPGLVWTVLADPEGNEFCVGQEMALSGAADDASAGALG